MLATQRMSSHGGQQNFPFGCMLPSPVFPLLQASFAYVYPTDQPENIHGIGLPEFITPGPPPGQPLLNAHENQNLDDFFHDFDQNAAANKSMGHAQFNMPVEHDQFFGMPPVFVGSETAMGNRSVVDPHQLQGRGFPYGNSMMGHDMNTLTQSNSLGGGMHGPPYSDATYSNPLITQLQTAAAMQPAYTSGWQHAFAAQNIMHPQTQGQQGVTFGTDSRFQASGYAAPSNLMDPDIPQGLQMSNPIDWLEPASASTTQPNTQPSSPNWSKKRNFDEFQRDPKSRNGFVPSTHSQQVGSAQPSPSHSVSRRKRGSVVKNEAGMSSQPATPLSTSKPHTPLNPDMSTPGDHEADAEAEEDDDATAEQTKSPSPAPWPSSKARPPRNAKPPPPPKPSRTKKASAKASTPIKPRSKVQRTSSSQGTPSTRVPLTLEQKKANHTNSEQRRRDATARAYAELYDLVPELEEMGKQSTMKKLEVVVAKVQRVKQGVEELRAKLGFDPMTGRPISAPRAGSGGLLYTDVPGWQH